jgi:hypothetical protein
VLGEIALPRVLIQQRYLSSIVAAGPGAGAAALRRLSALLADPLVTSLAAADLRRGLSPDQLAAAVRADWAGLRDLMRQPQEAPPKARAGLVERWLARGRHLAGLASGQARHRQVLDELAALRRSVNNLQKAQTRLEKDLRAGRHDRE